jgi:dihydroorotase
MIHIKHVTTIDGKIVDLQVPGKEARTIDARGLTLLPGLIDPHVHLRTPGLEHKENWENGARAAIQGGITMVFDMPNTVPATITLERVREKKALIDTQLHQAGIPLRYGLYLGADKAHFEEIARCKGEIVGIKLFMGSSTGDLLMDDLSSLHAIFGLAAMHDLLLAVHAEDEALIHERSQAMKGDHPRMHSMIRNEEVALRATQLALELARLYRTRLFLLHISTQGEVEAIHRAKAEGVNVFAETTPHHLFLTTKAYETLGTKVQMNPPIRSSEHVEALWRGIAEGVIDTIGSDHAPHTLQEKGLGYGKAPSGIPGLETTLPLLLDAHHQGRLSLQKIISLMHTRILEIFRMKKTDDYVLIDTKKTKRIEEALLQTKCGWSPYAGQSLTGWPVYTLVQGRAYELT